MDLSTTTTTTTTTAPLSEEAALLNSARAKPRHDQGLNPQLTSSNGEDGRNSSTSINIRTETTGNMDQSVMPPPPLSASPSSTVQSFSSSSSSPKGMMITTPHHILRSSSASSASSTASSKKRQKIKPFLGREPSIRIDHERSTRELSKLRDVFYTHADKSSQFLLRNADTFRKVLAEFRYKATVDNEVLRIYDRIAGSHSAMDFKCFSQGIRNIHLIKQYLTKFDTNFKIPKEEFLNEFKSTYDFYFKSSNLQRELERKQFHEDFVNSYCSRLNGEETPLVPWVVFMCGRKNCGKRIVIDFLSERDILPSEYFVHIGAKSIVELIPEYNLYRESNEAIAQCYEEAERLSKLCWEFCIAKRQNMLIDLPDDDDDDDDDEKETEDGDVDHSRNESEIAFNKAHLKFQRQGSLEGYRLALLQVFKRKDEQLLFEEEFEKEMLRTLSKFLSWPFDLCIYVDATIHDEPKLLRLDDRNPSWSRNLRQHFKDIREFTDGFPNELSTLLLENTNFTDLIRDSVFSFSFNERYFSVQGAALMSSSSTNSNPSSVGSSALLKREGTLPLSQTELLPQPLITNNLVKKQKATIVTDSTLQLENSKAISASRKPPTSPSSSSSRKLTSRLSPRAGVELSRAHTHPIGRTRSTSNSPMPLSNIRMKKKMLLFAYAEESGPEKTTTNDEVNKIENLLEKANCNVTRFNPATDSLFESVKDVHYLHLAAHTLLRLDEHSVALGSSTSDITLYEAEAIAASIRPSAKLLEIVLLNMCDGKKLAEHLSNECKIPYIIYWDSPVDDLAATTFGVEFWEQISKKKDPEVAFDAALCKVRTYAEKAGQENHSVLVFADQVSPLDKDQIVDLFYYADFELETIKTTKLLREDIRKFVNSEANSFPSNHLPNDWVVIERLNDEHVVLYSESEGTKGIFFEIENKMCYSWLILNANLKRPAGVVRLLKQSKIEVKKIVESTLTIKNRNHRVSKWLTKNCDVAENKMKLQMFPFFCEVKLRMSPFSRVSLNQEAKEIAGIPAKAHHFCWLYPLSIRCKNQSLDRSSASLSRNFDDHIKDAVVKSNNFLGEEEQRNREHEEEEEEEEWRGAGEEEEEEEEEEEDDDELDDPIIELFQTGGFLYFDLEGNMVNAIAVSGSLSMSNRLNFESHEDLIEEDARSLSEKDRWQKVTIPEFKRKGAKYFAWILPDEILASGRRYPKHGSFAYIFREKDKPRDKRDRFFAVRS